MKAKEFDERFDAGEDMAAALDTAWARRQWRCSVCADEGVISNWEDSPYDLRRRRLTVVPGDRR
jgi:hypothetical protein